MKTKIFLFLIATAMLVFISCSNPNEPNDIEDPMYPTTIYCLSEEILLKKRNDFAHRNPDIATSLNQFGFCASVNVLYGGPTKSGNFTEEEAIAAVKQFVDINPEYTGISNSNDLKFRGAVSSTSGYNDALFWYLGTENQIIKGIEVAYSGIMFHTKDRSLIWCNGNHFPDVYIPKKFNFNIERTKSQLLGKEIIHYGWTTYSAGFVTPERLQQSITKLIIIPVTTDEKIELRVCWQIYLEAPLHYIFEIDVMTGEIISEAPTIVF